MTNVLCVIKKRDYENILFLNILFFFFFFKEQA